ncbi:hypothetical protein JTB14_028361 [Gonioctena quinquepunctata]|nr:hypothetical protein JTB14_028361 [Gonioctena quinquepunctata]
MPTEDQEEPDDPANPLSQIYIKTVFAEHKLEINAGAVWRALPQTDGDSKIKEIMKKLKAMDFNRMSDNELSQELLRIRNTVETDNNVFLKELLLNDF